MQVIKLLLQEVCAGRCDVVGDGQQESAAGEDQGGAAGGERRVAGAALWFSACKVLQKRAAAVPGVQSIVKYGVVNCKVGQGQQPRGSSYLTASCLIVCSVSISSFYPD